MQSQSVAVPPLVPETTSAGAAVSVRRAPDRRYVTAALMLVMVLASMEQTITSTAMPTIIGDLRGAEHYSWVVSIYLLACTVSMPLYGRLADAWGRKRVLLGAIGLFLFSSVLASQAHDMVQLILYRGLQGLGAGGIMPVVLTILGDIFTLEERARIQGFFSAVWGTASLAGPALGAFLVGALGWRSVFFVNLPFGLLGLGVLVWKYHDHEMPHSTDLDLPGVVSLGVAALSLLSLVSRLGPDGWSRPVATGLAVAAVAATAYFVRHERRAANPILPPALMMNRSVGPSLAAGALLGVGIFAIDVYLPLYVQGGKGGGAAAAAGVVTPVMLMWALSGVVAAPLIVRWGFRKTALLGCLLVTAGLGGLLACAAFDAPRPVLTAVLALTGAGFGPASMAYLLAAQESVAWQQRGIVTSAVQFFRTIGGSVGIGLLGALLTLRMKPGLPALKAFGATPDDLLDAKKVLSPAAAEFGRRLVSGGLVWVFAAMLFFALVQIAVTFLMTGKKCEHPISRAEALESMAG